MTAMRKTTARLPAGLLDAAQAYTGKGVTETLRLGLEALAYQRFYAGMRELRGKLKFDMDLDELREDREFDERGNVIR